MKNVNTMLAVVIVLSSIMVSKPAFSQSTNDANDDTLAKSEPSYEIVLQQLWTANTILTFNTIHCIVKSEPGIDAIRNNVIANQAQIAKIIGISYGYKAGLSIKKMLYTNIVLAAYVMMAVRKGNTTEYKRADLKWRENSTVLYSFLVSNCSTEVKQATNQLMLEQINMFEEEMAAVKNSKQDANVMLYNTTVKNALLMSDFISNNITKRLPNFTTDSFNLISQN